MKNKKLKKLKKTIKVLNMLCGNPMVSYNYLLKKELGWSDSEIIENDKWKNHDAKRNWLNSKLVLNGGVVEDTLPS